MAKHQFLVGMNDDKGNLAGAQCVSCGQIALYVNGKIPADIYNQECRRKSRKDMNQTAARIVREANERE